MIATILKSNEPLIVKDQQNHNIITLMLMLMLTLYNDNHKLSRIV